MQKTLVIIKPDAVARRLIGQIVERFERKGITIRAMKMTILTLEQAKANYAVHKGKPFYDSLLEFMLSGPVVCMVLEGKGCIEVVRKMMGATFGPDAEPGTIRGDFGMSNRFNLVHASDSPERADYEIGIFFDDHEIYDYIVPDNHLVYDIRGDQIV